MERKVAEAYGFAIGQAVATALFEAYGTAVAKAYSAAILKALTDKGLVVDRVEVGFKDREGTPRPSSGLISPSLDLAGELEDTHEG